MVVCVGVASPGTAALRYEIKSSANVGDVCANLLDESSSISLQTLTLKSEINLFVDRFPFLLVHPLSQVLLLFFIEQVKP
jgi:hypothetical protein